MSKPRLEDQNLRYTGVKPGNAFDVCFKIIEKYGLGKAMSGKAVSDFGDVDIEIEDPSNVSKHFQSGSRITLSTIELLSMAYLTTYYQNQDTEPKKYFIGVDIEDGRKGQTERELYLSDGVLCIHAKDGETITPFQQVIAQNIVGPNAKNSIQEEIIRQTKKKIERRSTYNDVCGLIISALPGNASFDVAALLDSCDMEAFSPTFVMIYREELKTCLVEYLDNSIDSIEDLKERIFMIEPKLTKE
jgi:hypothetical protein